ncbi:MAG: DUF2807 domain-containing protein [Rikenellaceae bacterium]
MKKLLTITLLLLVVPILAEAQEKTKGSKTIITKSLELDLEGVTSIEASRTVCIEIVDKDISEIVVSANDNLMEYVNVYVVDGTLKATLTGLEGSVRRSKVKVKIPYNGSFKSFSSSSGSEILCDQYMQMPDLEIDVTTIGKVKIYATVAGNCYIRSETSGEVELTAKIVGNCDVKSLSSSEVSAHLSANELYVDASGASRIDVDGHVASLVVRTTSSAYFDGEYLKAQNGDLYASSGSAIIYFGTGNFTTNTTGTATITNTKFLNE